jgi:hypothetical protein
MDKETYDLLRAMPPDAPADACDLTDLEAGDIPWDRVPKIKELLESRNGLLAVQAAILLTHWGVDEGFDFLESFVCDRPPLTESWMPHRLRPYDDTYKHILDAFVGYWAKNATTSEARGNNARSRIKRPIDRIIELASVMPFGIEYFFWLVERKGFTEYVPNLKQHFVEILKNPEQHHWKVADCARLLAKIDPDFVSRAMAVHGKTLADFPSR